MPSVLPARALVRPRVSSREFGDSRLLEDVVAELVEEGIPDVIWIVGPPGGGKSTALAHLAACLEGDDRVVLLDDAEAGQVARFRVTHTVIATNGSIPKADGAVLRLQGWGFDEIVEYVTSLNGLPLKSVLARLAESGRRLWNPQVAEVVVRHFNDDASLTAPGQALIVELQNRLTNSKQREAAAEFCLASLSRGIGEVARAAKVLTNSAYPNDLFKLLRHSEFQLQWAGKHLVATLCSQKVGPEFAHQLPEALIELVAARCRSMPEALGRIDGVLQSGPGEAVHPMIASIKFEIDPQWRPVMGREPVNLAEGYFQGADWAAVDLRRARLSGCDLSSAHLADAHFENADMVGTYFDGADLHRAELTDVRAAATRFCGANLNGAILVRASLRDADFTNADLSQCHLTEADLRKADLTNSVLVGAELSRARLNGARFANSNLTSANLFKADLTQCDLRSACLVRACFAAATLTEVRMDDVEIEDAQFEGARLDRAHLTGSRLPRANFTLAYLRGAYLAEIDWEYADLRNADLRGATFHMGSSRSGLVGSPIACEGSKTGFYTDEREEIYFRRPEEVRKANLRGADLRGANIEGVDFYLVDLREAKLDRGQQRHARGCGAILQEEAA